MRFIPKNTFITKRNFSHSNKNFINACEYLNKYKVPECPKPTTFELEEENKKLKIDICNLNLRLEKANILSVTLFSGWLALATLAMMQ